MQIPIISKLLEKRSTANYVSQWLHGMDLSDFSISADEAVQLSTVYRCISLLAENTASMPLPIYEDTAQGRVKVRDAQAYRILNLEPNPLSTPFDFREAMMWQACLYGSAYAEKVRNSAGETVELWLIPSKRVKPILGNGTITYEVNMPDGKTVIYPQDKMFRINWTTDNGLTGLRPLALFRKVFELAVNTDHYANSYFKNGGAPSGVVTHNIDDTNQQKQMKADFKKAYTGKNGAHRVIFLQEGMTYTAISSPPNQSQMVESRKFNVIEICRLYNVQPHKVFEMENTIKSNIEQSSRDFIDTTLLPWAVRWQQSVYRDLFTKDQKRRYYAEMTFEALLRGDVQTRYAAYAVGRQWGWLSANDVRTRENMALIEGGDLYLTPMNMLDSSDISGEQQTQPVESKSLTRHDVPKVETRADTKAQQIKCAKARAKLASRHRPVFENAGAKISKRQANEVRKASRKYLGNGQTQQFLEWLTDYFETAKSWISRDIKAEALTLANAISDLAVSQVDGEELKEEDIQKIIDNYSDNFSQRNANSKAAQLKKIVDDNIQEENLKELIDERANEWEEKDPNKISKNETVFIASMIAREVFRYNGYQKLVFINTSGKSCPFCSQLDGKVVGINEPIIPKGESILADDGSNMRVYGTKMHTPIHQGCQCDIAPE